MTTATDTRPTLLVISQVYPPDPAAVGQHLADVAEEMVRRGWRVQVFTANRGYDDPSKRYANRETRAGVEIRRFGFSSFGKRSIAVRLIAQFLFVTQACFAALPFKGVSAILASTSPPFAGFFSALFARVRRLPLVWWVMDLNPDQMIATGRIGPRSLPARVFDAMNRYALRVSQSVIVLDRYMRDRIVSKEHVPAKIVVSPPWAAVEGNDPSRGAAFRQEHALHDHFVVMYSGNHALQHPLTTILDAAERLCGERGIKFVFVGGGAGKADVDRRIAAGAKNIYSLPYQPLEKLAGCLAAADLHVVSMGNDMVGIVHPCKIYGALASGRPVLYLGPRESHVADIIAKTNFGWHVSHGDVDSAVRSIREATGLPRERIAEIGQEARRLAEETFPRDKLIDAVCRQLEAAEKLSA